MKVRGGMLILRVITTTGLSAGKAQPQMHPIVSSS